MKIASIEVIKEIVKHPNADKLDVVKVLGYQAIVVKDKYEVGQLVVFIQPDTALPALPWAQFYKAKSNRVKAIRLRQLWSFGIVETPANVGYTGELKEGLEISDIIKVTKYEPPLPQELNAKGLLPFNLNKTDEERYQNIPDLPFREVVDVTQKIDGQSMSIYSKGSEFGVTGRSIDFKLDALNNYTKTAAKHSLVEKLVEYCAIHEVNLALRGELYGKGIQNSGNNPHSKRELGFALYSVFNLDTLQYELKGSPHYYVNVAKELGIETVPMIEPDVVLTPALINKYDEDLELLNGEPFEGVVIKGNNFTFKVINKYYDSKK